MISPKNVKIRQAVLDDAKLISVLATVTFYEAYFEQDEANDLANYVLDSFAAEKIRAEIANSDFTFFIVYRNEKAVGYAKLRRNSPLDCVTDENSIELQRIYILERVYGKGIGEILLAHCLKTAREEGFSTLWLGVWERNARAQRFYEKHGFVRVGSLTFPYGDTVGINFVLETAL
ncbi:MAG: GNAT family N-acetyltransferase [Pyrinomonadaceae bacterium]|nr:GNAT family N-acetyltransferase [Pyrinomonadaceae bacterium]